jgi:methyl-accepting chemotaxis protein
MRKRFQRLEFHWKLGLAINIPIIIIILLGAFISAYVFEKSTIREAINVRLKKNYEFAYLSLIKGHENMPIHVYKIFKQEFLEKFPGIKIYPHEYVATLFGSEFQDVKDENIKNVLNQGKEIINYNEKNKILQGYFPIKSESSCLVCHSNVGPGYILGAFSISIPLTSTLQSIATTKIILFILGLIGIICTSFILYVVYMKVGHRPISMISQYLNSISEGDLNFAIDSNILELPDIIGDLARNLNKLKEYLNNFHTRILDFSLKLTKQVDNVFKTVDAANKDVKAANMTINEVEINVDELYRIIGDVSRKIIQVNTLLRDLQNSLPKTTQHEIVDWEEVNKSVGKLNNEIVELIEKIEKIVREEGKVASVFEEISQIFQNLNKTLEQINNYVYESLIISTYMKNIASSLRLENMERIIFDIFETDLDRYLLRIESHIKGIEKLDPIRWRDPKALSLGKWFESEEYSQLRTEIRDFDFLNFEDLYKDLFATANEIIIAYNREDYLIVDSNLEKFRKTYQSIKGYLEELRHLYLEYFNSRKSLGGIA